jgi:hypothetical protein
MTNMTMAQRAAQAEREQREKILRNQEAVRKQASAWAGLDSLGTTPSSTSPNLGASQSRTSHDAFGFDDFLKPSSPSTTAISKAKVPEPAVVKPAADTWNFDDLAAAPPLKPSQSSATTTSASPAAVVNDDDDWGLEDFGSAPAATSPSGQADASELDFDIFNKPSQQPPSRSSTNGVNDPGDFDFGNREDGLLEDDASDSDRDGFADEPRQTGQSQAARISASQQVTIYSITSS